MKIYIFLILSFGVVAKCGLLEMSQVLWARLLAGGLAKSGRLDPLNVPVIKVDQSEGNTSYRIVLRNVEIKGLNFSTLESVHIARGKLKSNLSEFEAGYVSYTDLSELDSIRYRFHTLVKEPKHKNEPERSAHFTDRSNVPKSQSINMRNRASHRRTDDRNIFQSHSRQLDSESRDEPVDVVYAQSYKPFQQPGASDQKRQDFSAEKDDRRENIEELRCFGSCIRDRDPSRSFPPNNRNRDIERIRGYPKYAEFNGQADTLDQPDSYVSASESFGLKETSVGAGQPGGKIVSSPETRNNRKYENVRVGNSREQEAAVRSQAYQRQDGAGTSNDSNLRAGTDRVKNSSQTNDQSLPEGYVDIIYADNDDRKIKHFAGVRRKDEQNMKVYGLQEIRRILEQHNRYLIHNFTETEAIRKRNNMARAAAESKQIQDLVRYAENFQESDGYFEQGMQMVYHFGGMDNPSQKPESNEAKRRKREHNQNDTEVSGNSLNYCTGSLTGCAPQGNLMYCDGCLYQAKPNAIEFPYGVHQVEPLDDLMHVIMRLKVPMLQVKADYVLTGKVGRQILRGNGLLTGNFTDLIGDFTLELKKSGENTMIVRAARARLVAGHRKVTLQGMNEKGPVESVLVHGLMAAEAVAAMIADDLATKALSENPTTDAMIYKMYSNDAASPQ